MPVITLTHPRKGTVEVREDGSTFWKPPGSFGYDQGGWTTQENMVKQLKKCGYAEPTIIYLGAGQG